MNYYCNKCNEYFERPYYCIHFYHPEAPALKGIRMNQSRIPEFIDALDKMRTVHIKKNEDYAEGDNPFSNFDCSEYGLKLFPKPRDGSFAWPIFTKLARLSVLLNSNRLPNNESIEDSFIDIANYILLWRADYIRRKRNTSKAVTSAQSTAQTFPPSP